MVVPAKIDRQAIQLRALVGIIFSKNICGPSAFCKLSRGRVASYNSFVAPDGGKVAGNGATLIVSKPGRETRTGDRQAASNFGDGKDRDSLAINRRVWGKSRSE
ncbi:MAG: hypothetical protein AAF394_04565 [Planctomycetota bacterium]